MSSNATDDEVVQRVLDSFQGQLRGLGRGWILRTFMGKPPMEGYARQFSGLDAKERMAGSPLAIWHITRTEIAALPASFTVPAAGGRSGMYYDRGKFDFVVAPDRKSVIVYWMVGPRFGRGFRYDVVGGEDGRLGLRLADTLWIS